MLVGMEMVEVGVVFGGDLLDSEIGVEDSGLCIAELALRSVIWYTVSCSAPAGVLRFPSWCKKLGS